MGILLNNPCLIDPWCSDSGGGLPFSPLSICPVYPKWQANTEWVFFSCYIIVTWEQAYFARSAQYSFEIICFIFFPDVECVDNSTVLAFIALVFFSISATVHGDCASCCQGKWSQCFTICEDMDQCSECCSECTEEKETCVGNCPGSRSLKSAASISSSSFRRAFAQANNLKMHKFQRRLRKFVKRLNRRQIAWDTTLVQIN